MNHTIQKSHLGKIDVCPCLQERDTSRHRPDTGNDVPGWRVEKVSTQDLPKETEKIMHQVTIGITYPSEEYESGLWNSQRHGTTKNVPNHQPWQVTIVIPINHCKFHGIIMAFCHILPTNWCRKWCCQAAFESPCCLRHAREIASHTQVASDPAAMAPKKYGQSARYPATNHKFLAGERR